MIVVSTFFFRTPQPNFFLAFARVRVTTSTFRATVDFDWNGRLTT